MNYDMTTGTMVRPGPTN